MSTDNLLSALVGALVYSIAYGWLMWIQIKSSERIMHDLIEVLREERHMLNARLGAFESALGNIGTSLKDKQ